MTLSYHSIIASRLYTITGGRVHVGTFRPYRGAHYHNREYSALLSNTERTLPSLLLPAEARATRKWLVLITFSVFVCLFVCLSVCLHFSCAQYVTSYVTMQLQYIAAFGGLQAKLQQTKVVVSCLDDENLVGSRKDPVLVAYSY